MILRTRLFLATGLTLVALTTASLVAQPAQSAQTTSTGQTGSTTPAAQSTPTPAATPKIAVPAITPKVEQRFERPGTSKAPDRLAAEQQRIEEIRVRSYRPVVRIGQPYVLRAGEVTREVSGVLADVRIEGHVEGDVVAVLGDVTLTDSAVIDGALVVIGGSVTAASGAKVGRDLVLVGGALDAGSDFAPQGQHVIVGTAEMGQGLRAFVPWVTRGLLLGRVIVPGLRWIWVIVGIVFVLGLVLNLLFNKPVAACADTLARRPLSAFLMGLLTLAMLPVLLVILAATVVGLVVVPFAVAAFMVAILIGRISVTRALGRVIAGESDASSRFQASRSFAIGAALIVFAYMVPVLGLLTWMFVGSFGLGAATMTFFASLRRERPVPPPKPAAPPPSSPPPFAEPLTPAAPLSYTTPVASAFVDVEPPPVAPPAPPSVAATPRPPDTHAASGHDLTLYPRATFFDRVAAVALDMVLVGIASAFLGFERYRGPGPFFLLLFVYHVAFWAWRGTTLGGIICSLRVVRTNNAPMRFVDALVRGLSGIFSMVALGIGFFWMLNDAERQTWHDKIAGTVVVKLPRELVLD